MQFYGARYVTVKNCDILHTYDNAGSHDGCAIDIDTISDYMTLEDCVFGHSEGPGVQFLGSQGDNTNITITDCIFYNNCTGSQDNDRRYAIWAGVSYPSGTISTTGFYKNSIARADIDPDSSFTESSNIHSSYQSGWTPIYGYLGQIDVGGNGNVWGSNGGYVYQWDGTRTGSCWIYRPGTMNQVSPGSDGDVWGLNGNVYRWNGSWTQQPGILAQISCGSASNIWGVTSGTYIYRWNGSNWTNMPGLLQQIDASATGSYAWGVNGGHMYRWDGANWNWVSFGWSQVSCQDYNVAIAKNNNGLLYKTWNGGVSWTQLPGTMSSVSIGSDGSTWGIALNSTIWRYDP